MTMPASPRHVAVIDIGKTNAKLALVDLETLGETAVRRTPNTVLRDGPYPHYDTEALWAFVLDGLAALVRKHRVDAISVTTHGVAAALIDEQGQPALPVLDYEDDGCASVAAEYDALRPPFAETGTPRLPVGLNLAAQIFWQEKAFPAAFARVRHIVPYPQYWAWRLTGVLSTEVTSLGCHTDLWNPGAGDYSSLVEKMGWRRLMPPLRRASERLGPILPKIASRTGLNPETPVCCGIHDSNASLLPHLLSREAPFAVVSTGTWVVSMAIGAAARPLDPARDTLVNVNALGRPVPSARFMGGREFSLSVPDGAPAPDDAEIARVLEGPLMLTPSVERGSGPFPGRTPRWLPAEPRAPGERMAAVSFYLAMMTATCLDLIGARGATIVEGPFSGNSCFTKMLATATGRPVLASAGSTGTSIGAALLASGDPPAAIAPGQTMRIEPVDALTAYAQGWRAAVR
jgi:sugar (pentulose or hexulose) kinase